MYHRFEDKKIVVSSTRNATHGVKKKTFLINYFN